MNQYIKGLIESSTARNPVANFKAVKHRVAIAIVIMISKIGSEVAIPQADNK